MPWFKNRSGEQLWYEDAGVGTPLVFLHGWCMSSAVWQLQFEGLSASFRLIAPDLRGHGRSRSVKEPFGFEHFAADLVELLHFLDLENVVLIGWSMGAQIALQAYDDLIGRLAGLVLVSATPCFTFRKNFQFGLTPSEAKGMRLKVQRNIDRALSGFHTRMFADGEFETAERSDQVAGLLAVVVPPETLPAITALDSLTCADHRPLLPRISLDTLVVNGDQDVICLPQASDYLTEHLKSVRHSVFTGCGHAPFLTRAERFNREITLYAGSVCERIA